MTEKFVTLELGIEFRSKKVDAAIAKIWREFYSRIRNPEMDRAIWICSRFPAWVGVKPGSPTDDPDEEPAFVISALVDGIDSIQDELRARKLSEREYLKQAEPIYQEYYEWLRCAIEASWEQAGIQAMHAKKIDGEFGIYTTGIDDLSTLELSEMDWLAGDQLE